MEPPNRCSNSRDIQQQADCVCTYITDAQLRTDCEYAYAQFRKAFTDYCLPLMLENREDAFCRDFAEQTSVFPEFDSLPQGVRNLLFDDKHLGGMGYTPEAAEEVYTAVREGRLFPPPPARSAPSPLTLERSGIGIYLLPDILWIDSLDTSPHRFYGRFGARLDAYLYFDKGVFLSGGLEYLIGVGDPADLYNIDVVLSGGYFLRLAQKFGMLFFGGLKLGSQISGGLLTGETGERLRVSHFDATGGIGIRGIATLGKWGLSFGPEYWRTLSYQKEADPPLNSLLFTIGAEFDLFNNEL